MKKRQLYSVLLVALFALGGCGKAPVVEPTDFFDETIVTKNVEEEVVQRDVDYKLDSASLILDQSDPSDVTIIDSYRNLGLLIVKNSVNAVGFYSITYQKYLIKPMYNHAWLNYEVSQVYELGFFLKVNYEKTTLLIDSFSNVLYNGDRINSYSYGTNTYDDEELKDNIYLYLTIEGISYYFVYDKTFKAKAIDALPSNNLPTNVGDTFIGPNTTRLDDFGLVGYLMSFNNNNGQVIIYDPNGKIVSKFMLPTYSGGLKKMSGGTVVHPFLIGQNLYYQKLVFLPLDATEYDFYDPVDEGVKINYSMHKIPLLTGIEEEVSFPYLIDDFMLLRDQDNYYKLCALYTYRVNDANIFDRNYEVIVDEDLNIKQDVTNQYIYSFIKLGDNFYNTETNIIYDKDMKIITDLSPIEPTLLTNNKYFRGEINGKYGLVDTNGRLVLPFVYDGLGIAMKENFIFGELNGTLYRINVDDRSQETVDGELIWLNEEIAYVNDAEAKKVYFMDAKEVLYTYEYQIDGAVVISPNSQTFGDDVSSYLYVQISEFSGYGILTYLTFSDRPLDANNFVVRGEEVVTRWRNGQTIADAYLVTLGENNIHHLPNTMPIWLEFTPAQSGEYEITVPHYGELKLYSFDLATSTTTLENEGSNILRWDGFVGAKKYYYNILVGHTTFYTVTIEKVVA